ncbi:hypothetical protein FD754_010952, partial [Muntiacus muntjak]
SHLSYRFIILGTGGTNKFGNRCCDLGKYIKVLKEICIGELNPNETVQATLEAQLLSKLNHPAIVKFHANFVEQDKFCIITEYCEGRDLDCKIQEYKEVGKTFPVSQIIEWFIQLLLGVDYMHERKILHRDLKSKNIFLKNNKLKIGKILKYVFHERVYSRFYYYISNCNIKSLACILYEMCCMNHAFTGSNFLSIVLKIVEGDTPSLPERYPRQLNAIMESMLNKSPSLRPSAIEILKLPYIDEQLQDLMCRYSEMALEDKNLNSQEEAAYIINAVQKKIHLQTLRALSEVQKMTPRERMRVRKVQAADEEARKLKKLVEEKYEENNKRMQELRSRNFQRQTVDVLHEFDDPASDNLPESQPIPSLDLRTLGSNVEDTIADLGDHAEAVMCSQHMVKAKERKQFMTPRGRAGNVAMDKCQKHCVCMHNHFRDLPDPGIEPTSLMYGFASGFFAGVSLVHYLLFSKDKIWKHRTTPWAFLSKTIKLRTRQPPSSTSSDSLCVAEEPSPSRKRKPQDGVLSRWSRSKRPGPSLRISDRKGTYSFHK